MEYEHSYKDLAKQIVDLGVNLNYQGVPTKITEVEQEQLKAQDSLDTIAQAYGNADLPLTYGEVNLKSQKVSPKAT